MKMHEKRDKFIPKREAVSLQERQNYPMPYLNNKTAPYSVNGSAIPEVDFDIGESYAGSLPIDEGKSLWFWFVPSTNPAASNEIVCVYCPSPIRIFSFWKLT